MNGRSPRQLDRVIADRLAGLLAETCPDRARPGVLVALSGGPDSVALLLGARLWAERGGGRLAAAHLDHGLRGAEAGADVAFCRDLCRRLDVPCHTERVDVPALARRRGCGLEEAGRHARHDLFRRLLAEDGDLARVATGHHRDDQAETVIMRVFRGTGLDGLRGIRAARDIFVRPLLDLDRRQIVDFLQAAGQPWRTDGTNLDGDNLRARLRRELAPVVRDIFGPGADQVPARLAELAGADLALLERLAAEATGRLVAEGPEGPELDIPGLLDLDRALARRVLRGFLRTAGGPAPPALELVHVDGVLDWLATGTSGSQRDLPDGLHLRRDFDRLVAAADGFAGLPLRSAADYRIVVARAATCRDDAYRADHADGRRDPGPGPWRLTVPADCLRGPLRVRRVSEGDRLPLLGLDGSKLVSDLLRERRVPVHLRARILVVDDDDGILWVVGLARAERTRLLPATAQAVTIYLAVREQGDPRT